MNARLQNELMWEHLPKIFKYIDKLAHALEDYRHDLYWQTFIIDKDGRDSSQESATQTKKDDAGTDTNGDGDNDGGGLDCSKIVEGDKEEK